MQSLKREIQSFSRTRLRKQCTRVTSLSGRRIIETWKGSTITVVEDSAPTEKMLGYVPDTSWDLQVGVVKPFLLLVILDYIQIKGVVLVHCNTGVSRAPSVVIAYLMSRDGRSFDDALSLVRSARPASSPNPGFLDQLKSFRTETAANGSRP
ncbi:dual specificity protein phosphatase 19-like [Solea solea]|uniref:dual specificity protein phosphatase 19-like n=1 Tax=Solea solea TaxID=90069 RepID=UPI00272D92D1|nr:dual specificity protein phosphatase 19-like [Solea solea]